MVLQTGAMKKTAHCGVLDFYVPVEQKMKKLFSFLILFPLMIASAFILMIHRFRPQVWSMIVRPAVCRMRRGLVYEYIESKKSSENRIPATGQIACSISKEFQKIIRYIKMEAEYNAVSMFGAYRVHC